MEAEVRQEQWLVSPAIPPANSPKGAAFSVALQPSTLT